MKKMFGPLCLLACLTLLPTPHASAKKSDSLCNKGESVYFTCQLRKKRLSLCGTPKTKQLFYRFGRKGKIELQYPKKPKTARKAGFKYTEFHPHPRLTHMELSFRNGHYKYSVFSLFEHGSESAGVTVKNLKKKKKKAFRLTCKDADVAKFYLIKKLLKK